MLFSPLHSPSFLEDIFPGKRFSVGAIAQILFWEFACCCSTLLFPPLASPFVCVLLANWLLRPLFRPLSRLPGREQS